MTIRRAEMSGYSEDFLARDHEISLDKVISIINSEISWCYKYSIDVDVSKEFKDGFIAGLKQSKRLILELAKLEDEEE